MFLNIYRLHINCDLSGLWDDEYSSNKSLFIYNLFHFITDNKIKYTDKPKNINYNYRFNYINDHVCDIVSGVFLRYHDTSVPIIMDEETLTPGVANIENTYEQIRFFYHRDTYLLFLEDTYLSKQLGRRLPTVFSKLLLQGLNEGKGLVGDVSLTTITNESFSKEVRSLRRVSSSSFILWPTNPSRKIWDDLDQDLKKGNVAKRKLKDTALPDKSLQYEEGTPGAKLLAMTEDGYGEAIIFGEDNEGNKIVLDSKENVHRYSFEPQKETDYMHLFNKAITIAKKYLLD